MTSIKNERGIVNMTKKVTLPREVAEAIEGLRRLGKDNRWIIEAANGVTTGTHSLKIRSFAYEDSENFDTLLDALVNGYEIEKTPEEKVREYYDDLYVIASNYDPGRRQYEAECKLDAVKETLDLLGIQIEGINA